MKWFKHFTRAHEDRAIEKIIIEFGVVGYGLYFYCVEIIAGSLEVDNITFELEPDAEILARRLAVDTLLVERIIKRCIELKLFEMTENGRISCMKISKFFDQGMTSNPHMRKIFSRNSLQVSKSLDKIKSPLDKITSSLDQIRLDEIRLDKKNTNTVPAVAETVSKSFKKPTVEEVKAYCTQRGNSVNAQAWIDHYESNGWKVGKASMKDWQAAVRTWERQSFGTPATSPEPRKRTPPAPDVCTACGKPLQKTVSRAMCKCGETWDLIGDEWRLS